MGKRNERIAKWGEGKQKEGEYERMGNNGRERKEDGIGHRKIYA